MRRAIGAGGGGVFGWWDDLGGWTGISDHARKSIMRLRGGTMEVEEMWRGGSHARSPLAFVHGAPMLKLRGGQGQPADASRIVPAVAAREGKWPFFLQSSLSPVEFRKDALKLVTGYLDSRAGGKCASDWTGGGVTGVRVGFGVRDLSRLDVGVGVARDETGDESRRNARALA